MNKASKLKKISAICAAFMFALLSIFAALVTQKEEIRASAEASGETDPYKNYFAVENSSAMWNGLTFTWENGVGSVSGKLTKNVNEPYSFNLTATIPTFRYLYYRAYVDFSGTIITGLALSTVHAGGLVADGFICSFPKFEVNELYQIMKTDIARSCYFWIKGNAGDTVNLPFIYPYISDNSLDNSHLPKTIEDMLNEKYKAGYAAASDDLSLGVLKGSKISATFTYENGTKTITDEEPVFTYNGIDLSGYASKYYYNDNNSDYILETADVTITFAEAFTYEAFPIGFYGNSASVVYGGYFIGSDGKQYSCERDVSSNGSAFKIGEGTYDSNLQVKAIKIGFGRASDTLNGTVIVHSGQYRNGYANGYNDGEFAGFSDGVKVGKKDGYEAGYNEGYSYGMNVSDGGFIKLLSATIDAPVKAFTSLLNFEVLGVNMKDFVISILTLMFVLTIVRFCLGRI